MLPKYEPTIMEHANGGKGSIILTPIAKEDILKDHCRLFSEARLKPGCSMGVHQHKGDGEIYHIISGRGLYTDNGKTYEVGPGDTTWCPDGSTHGLENIGDEDLVFIALIIYNK